MANLFELPRYIAVEGPIRVGKSTLAAVLAERLHAHRISEPENNPFLRAFYDGERGAAFLIPASVSRCWERMVPASPPCCASWMDWPSRKTAT